MRIRTIKPEWLDDQKLSTCTPMARVLSVALILLADDYGNGRADPSYLRGLVFRNSRGKSVIGAIRELVECGYIVIYAANGDDYYHISNWSRHQLVKNPSKPRVPKPDCGRISVESPEILPLDPDPDQDPDLPPVPAVSVIEERKQKREPLRNGVAEVVAKTMDQKVLAMEVFYLGELQKRGITLMRLSMEERRSMRELCEISPNDAEQTLKNYFASKEDFYRQEGWPIRLLMRHIAKFSLKKLVAAPTRDTRADAERIKQLDDESNEQFEAVECFNQTFQTDSAKLEILKQNHCAGTNHELASVSQWGSKSNHAVLAWYRQQTRPRRAKNIDTEVVMEQVKKLVGEITW